MRTAEWGKAASKDRLLRYGGITIVYRGFLEGLEYERAFHVGDSWTARVAGDTRAMVVAGDAGELGASRVRRTSSVARGLRQTRNQDTLVHACEKAWTVAI